MMLYMERIAIIKKQMSTIKSVIRDHHDFRLERNYFTILRNVGNVRVMDGRINDSLSLNHVHEDYKKDRAIALAAISRSFEEYQYVPDELKASHEFMRIMITQYQVTLKDASPSLRKYKDLVAAALGNSIDEFQYASDAIKRMKHLFWMYFKEIFPLYRSQEGAI